MLNRLKYDDIYEIDNGDVATKYDSRWDDKSCNKKFKFVCSSGISANNDKRTFNIPISTTLGVGNVVLPIANYNNQDSTCLSSSKIADDTEHDSNNNDQSQYTQIIKPKWIGDSTDNNDGDCY